MNVVDVEACYDHARVRQGGIVRNSDVPVRPFTEPGRGHISSCAHRTCVVALSASCMPVDVRPGGCSRAAQASSDTLSIDFDLSELCGSVEGEALIGTGQQRWW